MLTCPRRGALYDNGVILPAPGGVGLPPPGAVDSEYVRIWSVRGDTLGTEEILCISLFFY